MTRVARVPDGLAWWLVAVFLLTRGAMVALWRHLTSFIVGDVGYYYTRVLALPEKGIEATMTEYPTPVVWLLAALLPAANSYTQYVLIFALAMFVLDALFALLLWRRGGPHRAWATAYWIAFIPLVGPLLYFRFDLLPAVLAGAGLLWLASRPRLAGALIGLGAATKLWPALLILPMAVPRRQRWRTLAGFAGIGFGLALLSLVAGGWQRLISPLAWQSDRGLQVEAILATPLMFLRTFGDRNEWQVVFSKFNAFEVIGPGADLLLTASTLLTAAGMLTIGWLCWLLFRTRPRRAAVGLVVLAIVAIMIVTNKTLSPQYVVWLAGPLAVLLADRHGNADQARQLVGLALGSLAIAGLTQLVYPLRYDDLVLTASGKPVATLVLTLRNLGLLLWTCWLVVVAARACASSPTSSGDRTTPEENR